MNNPPPTPRTDACPHCGAKSMECGTYLYRNPDYCNTEMWERSDKCRLGQAYTEISALKAKLDRAREALKGVKWERRGREFKTPWATVWESGTWHTWDADGVGGENGSEKTIDDAKAWATYSALCQGFILQHAEALAELES